MAFNAQKPKVKVVSNQKYAKLVYDVQKHKKHTSYSHGITGTTGGTGGAIVGTSAVEKAYGELGQTLHSPQMFGTSLIVVPATIVGGAYVGTRGNKRYAIKRDTKLINTNNKGYSIMKNGDGEYDVTFVYGKHFYVVGKGLKSESDAKDFIKTRLSEKPSPVKTFLGSASGRVQGYYYAKNKEKKDIKEIERKENLKKAEKDLDNAR
jgi:hypothetical protein